jgi:hypothetical protein
VTSGPTSWPFGRPAVWIAAHGVQIFFGAVILWVIGVFLLVTFEPEAGAGSTTDLQAAVRSSVTSQDADRFARLFADGTVGGDYPATLLTRLEDAGTWSTEVRENELVLTGVSGCLSWELTRADDRWLLDGVPALRTAC